MTISQMDSLLLKSIDLESQILLGSMTYKEGFDALLELIHDSREPVKSTGTNKLSKDPESSTPTSSKEGRSYYAVKSGRSIGVFNTWSECKKEVKGYSGAEFRKFSTRAEAEEYVKGSGDLIEYSTLAYVDGSYNKTSGEYGWGVVLIDARSKEVETHQGSDAGRNSKYMNVAGELSGVIHAVELALSKGLPNLAIHYDYAGIEKWVTGSWTARNEFTQGYRDYMRSVRQELPIAFIKVKAHSGNKYNELADQLAKSAVFR